MGKCVLYISLFLEVPNKIFAEFFSNQCIFLTQKNMLPAKMIIYHYITAKLLADLPPSPPSYERGGRN